jgi:hypothetical protein
MASYLTLTRLIPGRGELGNEATFRLLHDDFEPRA